VRTAANGGRGAVRIVASACALSLWTAIGAGILTAGLQSAKPPPRAALTPLRIDRPPVIDGILDDEVWRAAPSETGFKTWTPDFGKDMRERTIVYYAHDRENLYFAYRCYDSEPARIKASVAARDTIVRDDWVCLNLDTFNDRQSLYALYVNPLGIQGDSRFAAGQEDYTVDVVWYSAGRIDSEGYTIEIRIPFKSIRYRHREPVEMGIIFERRISRLSEGGTYPPLDPAQGANFLTQTRTLLFTDIAHYTLLEALPAFTYGRNSLAENGALAAGKARSELSLTAKLGLTSQLVLDGTVNPDFSQVESDVGQVDFNLRYAPFYPEKRPFFLEGRENFIIAAAQSGDPLEAVVHTRTIVDPYLGFKLTGKVSPKDAIAAIYALDELPGGSLSDGAHFTIARYKHALREDGYLGAVWTGRSENLRSNFVTGADGLVRLTPASYVAWHGFASRTKADGETGTSDGHALGFEFNSMTRDVILNFAAQDLSEDFATGIGYLTRTGVTRLKAGVLPMIYPKSKLVLRIDPLIHSIQTHDKPSGLWETFNSFDLRLILPRNTSLLAGARYATEVFGGERFGRSAFRFTGSSQLTKQVNLSLSYLTGQKIRYVDDPYQGRGSDASFIATILPSEKLRLEFRWTASDFIRSSDGVREYDYTILRGLAAYQVNKYLFFRAIVEHNSFRQRLTTDLLASFTYIPGTVVHVGYGSLYEKLAWRDGQYEPADSFLETKRGFFFKASYLWRL
jgi:hypothetical protein